MTDRERLDELEMRAAFQEEMLRQLSDALGDQQVQIGRLEETCRALVERVKSLQGVLEDLPGDAEAAVERPPHY